VDRQLKEGILFVSLCFFKFPAKEPNIRVRRQG